MSEAALQGSPGNASPAHKEPSHLRRVILIWVILSVIGVVLWLAAGRFILPVAADETDAFDNYTMMVFTAMSIPVALFVWTFMGYSLVTFRVKRRSRVDGIPLQPKPVLQISWLGITSALCLFLIVWGMVGLYKENSVSLPNTLVIKATGQQWAWTFGYPQYGIANAGATLELPVNRPVQFSVTSKDVLHGFTIRALGIRLNANPGEIIDTIVVTPTRTGEYPVVCTEMCGLGHTYMATTVKIVDQATFTNWVRTQGGHP